MPELFFDFFDETTTRVQSVVREKNIYNKYNFVVFVESKQTGMVTGTNRREGAVQSSIPIPNLTRKCVYIYI